MRRMMQTRGNAYVQRVMASLQRESAASDPVLRPGSRSPAVSTLQQHLVSAGASIAVDGIFGSQTRRALVAFQRAAGLAPDGVAGPQTWSSLKSGGATIAATPGQGGAGGKAGPTGGSQAALIAAKISQIKAQILKMRQGRSATAPAQEPAADAAPAPHAHAHDAWGYDDPEGEDESWLDTASNWVDEQVDDAAGWVEEQVDDAADWVDDTADEAAGWVDEQVDDATDWVDDTANWVDEQIDDAADWVDDTVDEAAGWVDDLSDWAADTVSDIGEVIDDFTGGVRDLVDDAIDVINNVTKGGMPNPLKALEDLLDTLKSPPDGAKERPVEGSAGAISDVAMPLADGCDLPATPDRHPRKPHRIVVDLSLDSDTHQGETPDTGWGHDSVDSSGVWLSSSITGGGPVDKGWGKATPKFGIDLIYWRLDDGVVKIGARLKVNCTWGVRSNGCIDVNGPYDNSVASVNWKHIVDELSPSGPNGEPTRSAYWSSSITQAHELFHCQEYISRAGTAMAAEQARLNTKSIDTPWLWVSEEDEKRIQFIVRSMMEDLRKNVAQNVFNYYHSGGEDRAYASGRTAYQNLVNSIKTRAHTEGWPGA